MILELLIDLLFFVVFDVLILGVFNVFNGVLNLGAIAGYISGFYTLASSLNFFFPVNAIVVSFAMIFTVDYVIFNSYVINFVINKIPLIG